MWILRTDILPFLTLPVALCFLSSAPPGHGAVEYRKIQKEEYLTHHYICRHPEDLTKGFDPAYVQLNFGHTVRHLPTATVATVKADEHGVSAVWVEPQAEGSPFKITTTQLHVPRTVLPQGTVKAMLGSAQPLSPEFPLLPTIAIGEQAYSLPFPDGFHRLDKRLKSFDDEVNEVMQETTSEVMAIFGLVEENDRLARREHPGNKRIVAIEYDHRRELRTTDAEGFQILKKRLMRIPRLFNWALKDPRRNLTGSNLFKLSVRGKFAEDETSYLFTVLGSPKETGSGIPVVHSYGVMLLHSNVIAIHAFADFESPADETWTQEACLLFRDAIRKVNGISPATGQ